MQETGQKPVAGNREAEATAPRRPSRRQWLAGAAAVAGAGMIGGLGYAAASSRLEVTRIRRSLGLPPGAGLRLAVAADLHLRGKPEDYEQLLEAIRAARPDALVFPGDTIERPESADLVDVFAAIEPPLGKLATLGNRDHESGVSIPRIEAVFERAGIRLLVNERTRLGELEVLGLDDWLEGEPDASLIGPTVAEGPTLVLTHCPVVFDDEAVGHLSADEAARSLFLSGHTHGGQIAPGGLALYTPEGSGDYVAGWYVRGKTALYVSRGIGYSIIPVRMGSRPELVILEVT